MEFAENEQRQGFTVSERLEYAEKIKAIEQAKARERKSIYARDGRDEETPDNQDRDTCPYPEKGRTRDAIAKNVGLGSGRQYDRAIKVAAKRPDLMEKIDKGETTIGRAYKETLSARQVETPGGEPPKSSTPLPNDQVARAKHERLMKNPLYTELREKYAEAVKDANLARRERDFKIEGYDKRIRACDENADYMRRIIDRLEAENAELRRRLGIPPDEKVVAQE
ncbi:MAG: hypothetical protein GX592_08195 [Clostridiales bacterium]|nr:hypothetical protein [Clostridiales bacterium]